MISSPESLIPASGIVASSERGGLFRELAEAGQQVRLLMDIFDAVVSSSSLADVMETLENGLRNVLPVRSFGAVRLALLDDPGASLRVYTLATRVCGGFWSNIRKGALAAGRDLDVAVTFIGMGNKSAHDLEGPEGQMEAFRAGIRAGVDGIAVAPMDAERLEPLIGEARRAGIPVIAFDTPPVSGSEALAYIGTDNVVAGKLAGEAMRNLLPEGGTVNAAAESFLTRNSVQRLDGFREALAGSNVRVERVFEDSFNPAEGKRLALAAMAARPDLAGTFGICGNNGAVLGDALVTAGRAGRVKLVCFDIGADTIRLLKAGTAHAVIAQREHAMGYVSVQLLARMAARGVDATCAELPASRAVDTGVDIVTLERTPWSISLADYILHAEPRKKLFDRELLADVERLKRPLRILVIGIHEAEPAIAEVRVPLEPSTLLARALGTAEPVVVDPLAPEAADLLDLEQARRAAHRTAVAMPIFAPGTYSKARGVLTLESSAPDACAPSDLLLLEQITSVVAVVLENARLFREAEHRAAELREANQRQEALLKTILELSSPVVPIAPGILVVPLTGVVDTERADRFKETLTRAIVEHRAAIVLIDITGVASVDAHVAHRLMQAAQAARLLGAEVALVGINPTAAQAMASMDVDLSGVVTRSTLESGFAYALSRTRGRIVYRPR